MPKIFFKLQEDERIVENIKPLPALRWYFLVTWSLGWLFALVWFIWIPFIFVSLISSSIFIPLFLIVLFVFTLLLANQRYKHQHYWLTNKRVISKRGLLGYRVNSIPLERISDVIVSRSFVERLFGFGSVLIQSLAGQVTPGRRWGAEGSLLAVPNPEDTQKKIFDLIKQKRKREHITM